MPSRPRSSIARDEARRRSSGAGEVRARRSLEAMVSKPRRVRIVEPVVTSERVLRIIDRLNVGGPAQATVLSEGLDPERFDHRILTGSVDAHEGDYVELRAPDLPVQGIEGLGRAVNPLDDARAFGSLIQVIRTFRPHIVHTHKAKAGVLGRAAAWANRVPATVHTFHGHLLHGYFRRRRREPSSRSSVCWRAARRRSWRSGAQVRDELLTAKIGRPDQYTVVPPGVALPSGPEPAAAPHARVATRCPRRRVRGQAHAGEAARPLHRQTLRPRVTTPTSSSRLPEQASCSMSSASSATARRAGLLPRLAR
jgi:hypothetical protein